MTESQTTRDAPYVFLATSFTDFWRQTVAVTVGSICLLAGPSVATWAMPTTRDLIARLHNDVLDARDLAQQRRGYYEQLDTDGVNRQQNGWFEGMKVFYGERSDILGDRPDGSPHKFTC